MLWNARLVFPSEIYRRMERAIDCLEETTYIYSSDEFLTGRIYEFRGEFDFNEFRRKCRFFLERETDVILPAQTPKTAASLIQARFFAGLWQQGGSPWIYIVYFCPETDNWVVGAVLPEGVAIFGEELFNIFAINRSSGEVVEFSLGRGNFQRERAEGWRRTAGAQRYFEFAMLAIMGTSVIGLTVSYSIKFVSSFKKNDVD